MRVPIGVPGGGVRGRVQGGGGGDGFSVKNKGKREGGGEGWGGRVGTGKGTGKSTRKLCRDYPLAIYPLVSPLLFQGKRKHIPVVQLALQTEKNYFRINYAFFIAGTDADENMFGSSFFFFFVVDADTAVLCSFDWAA